MNLAHLAANCLAMGKVLYKGHAVAAVAAANVHLAEEAAARIKVEYEVLPSVTWVLDAMKDDAPLLHDDLRTDSMGKKGDRPTNVAAHLQFEKGNIAEGFQQADVVVEREFRTASVHQGYIEPHATVALWNEDNRLKIWTATQGAFNCRQQVAELLQIPVSQCVVVPCEIGGGFGGKIAVYLEPVAALLSRKCGRPVKMVMQRNEVFEATGPTPGSFMRVKLGATKDGKLEAGEAWLAYDCGAFPGGVIGPGCMCVFSCYELPNARVDGFDVVRQQAQDPGLPRSRRDPGGLRLRAGHRRAGREAGHRPDRVPPQERGQGGNAARRRSGLSPRRLRRMPASGAEQRPLEVAALRGKNRGRGIAGGFWFNIGLASSCSASVNADGTVTLVEGSTDIGGTRTSIAMQLAETLGIGAEDVQPQVGRHRLGRLHLRHRRQPRHLRHRAGRLQARPRHPAADEAARRDHLGVRPGGGRSRGRRLQPERPVADVQGTGGEDLGARPRARSWAAPRSSPEGSTNAFGVHIADVEVDPETGKVTILRYTAIQDAGKAIHPSYVEGQMQGGAVQGIGWALNEEYFFDAQGPDAERQLPRLPHAHLPRRADDRHDHRRGPQPVASLSACAASARRRSSLRPPRSPTPFTRPPACA